MPCIDCCIAASAVAESLPEEAGNDDVTPGLISDDNRALPLRNLSVAAKLVDLAAEVCDRLAVFIELRKI